MFQKVIDMDLYLFHGTLPRLKDIILWIWIYKSPILVATFSGVNPCPTKYVDFQFPKAGRVWTSIT